MVPPQHNDDLSGHVPPDRPILEMMLDSLLVLPNRRTFDAVELHIVSVLRADDD